jgi:NitT/TauT family transport system substrate-binding protein
MGYFGADLPGVIVEPAPFGSNAAEMAAIEGGRLDAAYMDPVAAVTAWQSSPGGLIKIIAGAASGGAELVVRSGITSARQLAHAPLAAPAGGAQQAALNAWLRQQGQSSPGAGHITMTSSYLVRALKSGHIAGAWEPAPQDAQMVAAGGHVLVNEASLWPGGRFATAVLVVTQRYLSAHPGAVTGLLKGQVQAENLIVTAPASAAQAVNQELATRQGSRLPASVLTQSFAQIAFTNDPLASSILAEAQHAAAAGLLKPVRTLSGIYDLGMLNKLLRSAGQRPVSS